jgi:hypothetical protein
MQPLFKVPVKNGIIAGLLGALLVIGLYYLDRHPFLIPVFLDFRIFLFGIFIFFTLKEFRDFYQGRILYFWQGLFASFIFTLVFALVASACIWMFIEAVPEVLTRYIEVKSEELRASAKEIIERLGKEDYERNLKLLPTTNAMDLALLYLVQSFLISFPISIILSVILRSHQPKP